GSPLMAWSPDYCEYCHDCSFLYDLQVGPGLARSTYGSGLNELENLDAEAQYNTTIIEPIFPSLDGYDTHGCYLVCGRSLRLIILRLIIGGSDVGATSVRNLTIPLVQLAFS